MKWVNEEHDTRSSKLAETKLDPKSAKNAMAGLLAAWKSNSGSASNGAATSYNRPGADSSNVADSDIPF